MTVNWPFNVGLAKRRGCERSRTYHPQSAHIPPDKRRWMFCFVVSKYLEADNILVRKVAFVLVFVPLLAMAEFDFGPQISNLFMA